MSNKKSNIKIDINQGYSPIVTMYLCFDDDGPQNFHVEDIAIKNKEMFPNFFTWSKHKANIDLRQFMRTMDNLKKYEFVEGSNTTTWSLTKKGMKLAEEISKYKLNITTKKRRNANFYSRELRRLYVSDAYLKFKNNRLNEISEIDLNYLFRIDNYSSDEQSLLRNKERLYKACFDDQETTKFLDEMITLIKKFKT